MTIELRRDYRYFLYRNKVYGLDEKEGYLFVIMKTAEDKVIYAPVNSLDIAHEITEYVKRKKARS